MKPLTHEWVKKAENDFKVASQILRRRKDRVPDAACFFCQQCVEKYLKARLLEAAIPFPRTHDLLQLLNACLPVELLWLAYCWCCCACVLRHRSQSLYEKRQNMGWLHAGRIGGSVG